MMSVEKYDASAQGASRKNTCMVLDHRNLSWIKIFLNFSDFS